MNIPVIILSLLNALWFAMGFRLFFLNSRQAAKLLLAPDKREEPYFSVLAEACKFLGGMNLALSMLSIFCIYFLDSLLSLPLASGIFIALGLAHFSQFWVNLPHALKERKGEQAIWPVLRKTMRFIFVVDFLLAAANFGMAIMLGLS